MSTGLTYVFISDESSEAVPLNGGTFIFSAYEEAYNHGEWLTRNFSSSNSIVYTIYTTGPNQNGFWSNPGVTPVFTPLD